MVIFWNNSASWQFRTTSDDDLMFGQVKTSTLVDTSLDDDDAVVDNGGLHIMGELVVNI